MRKVQRVLDVAGIAEGDAPPKTVKRAADHLQSVVDAMDTLSGGHGRIVPSLRPDWRVLLDLWTHADMRLGQPQLLAAKDNMPEADPISMIDAGCKYAVITPEKAQAMKAEFMAKASAAAGVELSEAQVKKLHRLFLNNNPFRGMKLK